MSRGNEHTIVDMTLFCWHSVNASIFVAGSSWNPFLPPATKLGQGYVFTGVCDSVHRGVGGLPQCMLGYPPWRRPPRADTFQEQTPPWSRPPGANTTPEQTPPSWEQTPSLSRPPRADTPQE